MKGDSPLSDTDVRFSGSGGDAAMEVGRDIALIVWISRVSRETPPNKVGLNHVISSRVDTALRRDSDGE